MSQPKTKNKKIEEELENEVMEKIKKEEIKMKPKWYFYAGSGLMVFGLGAAVFVSIFLLNLVLFALRSHGPMGQWRIDLMIDNFPWWALFVAVGGIVLSLILLRKYEFSYKNNYWVILIIFLASVFLALFVIDIFNIDRLWQQKGPMRGMYRRYERMENGQFPGNGHGMMRGKGRFEELPGIKPEMMREQWNYDNKPSPPLNENLNPMMDTPE